MSHDCCSKWIVLDMTVCRRIKWRSAETIWAIICPRLFNSKQQHIVPPTWDRAAPASDHWLQTWLVSCLQTLLPHRIIFASESRDEKIECWGGGGRWSQTESIWRWCGGGGVAIERGILYFYFCLAQCSLKISKIVCEVLALIQSRYFGNIKLELIESK